MLHESYRRAGAKLYLSRFPGSEVRTRIRMARSVSPEATYCTVTRALARNLPSIRVSGVTAKLRGGLRRLGRHERKGDREAAAFVQLARNVDRAAMSLRDPVDEAEPEPQAALGVERRPRRLVEAIEDVRQMLAGDAAPGVLDDH